jgi:hypothetical protein
VLGNCVPFGQREQVGQVLAVGQEALIHSGSSDKSA